MLPVSMKRVVMFVEACMCLFENNLHEYLFIPKSIVIGMKNIIDHFAA